MQNLQTKVTVHFILTFSGCFLQIFASDSKNQEAGNRLKIDVPAPVWLVRYIIFFVDNRQFP
jgi:hypothetical protein